MLVCSMRFPRLQAAMFFALTALLSQSGAAFAAPKPVPARASAPAPAPTVIDSLGKGSVQLVGPWQFHEGDDPAWASPDFDDSGWEHLKGDAPWSVQGHAGYTGFAWYRLHLRLNPAPGADANFALMLFEVDGAYGIYWNGVPIGHSGKLPPHPVWYVNRPAQTYGLGPARTGVLAIRVWKAPLAFASVGDYGGLRNAPVVGGLEAIRYRKDATDFGFMRFQMVGFAISLLYIVVAMLSLAAWLREPGQWRLFWITAYSLFPVISLFIDDARLPMSNIVRGFTMPVSAIQQIALWFLLMWLLQLQRDRRLVRLTELIALISLCAAVLQGLVEGFLWSAAWDSDWVTSVRIADGLLGGLRYLLSAFPLVLIASAVIRRRRLDQAGWVLSAFAGIRVLLGFLGALISFTWPLTHWGLVNRFYGPLFEVNGGGVSVLTLADTLVLAAIVYAVYRHSAEKRRRQTVLEQEFKSAREVQQVLIPETVPTIPGFALTSAYRPAQEVGGDFFQIIPLEDESTLIVLGDVSGKGLKAAMAVSLIVGVVHTLAEGMPSPGRLLTLLNRRLTGRLQGGFTTCVALRIEPDGSGRLASAGHPGPYLNGREFNLPGALPLGLSPATTYVDFPFFLDVDDHLSLFTDGLLEARSPSGEVFSFERLKRLFASRPTATEATQAAVNFGQDDDITVVTLTRLATGKVSTATFAAPVGL